MSTELARRSTRLVGETVRYGVVLFATVVVGYPVLWMLMQSLKTKFEMYANV